jgi:integrase
MDLWSLSHLGLLLVLPMRPEEVCGLLISDVDFVHGQLSFATRFEGRDFTKGRQSFRVPFPPELLPLLGLCRGKRDEGPLLQARAVFDGRRRPKVSIGSTVDVQACFRRSMAKAASNGIKTEQDTKNLFRQMLRKMGGASPYELQKAFKTFVGAQDWGKDVRMYDLRGAVSTDMNRSGMSLLELRYLTGHATRDIMNAYVSLDIAGAMALYFKQIQPLLAAIAERTKLLVSNRAGDVLLGNPVTDAVICGNLPAKLSSVGDAVRIEL